MIVVSRIRAWLLTDPRKQDCILAGFPDPFKLNRTYYFAVTAYGYNPFGVPRTLESSINMIVVRPQTHTTWSPHDSTASHGDNLAAEHITGNSNGSV